MKTQLNQAGNVWVGREGSFGGPSAEVGSQPRSCVKVEVDVQGSPSLTVRRVSVDVQQHQKNKKKNGGEWV